MEGKQRLGRGLDALIPQITPEDGTVQKDTLNQIKVDKIRTNPMQPRLEFDSESLKELKQSIAENGIIQPITVRRLDEGFELIAGERRLRAVQELGYERIPAFVMDVKSQDQLLELALVENIQREDLNPLELARAYQRLQSEYELTQEAIAQKVGKDRATIANFMRLLKLPEIIQESLRKDEISMGHARALMSLPSRGEQIQLWRKIVKQGWSVRKVEETARNRLEGIHKPGTSVAGPNKSPHLVEVQDRLRTLLSSRVNVRTFGKGGKIEIIYYSDEDLNRILNILDQIRV